MGRARPSRTMPEARLTSTASPRRTATSTPSASPVWRTSAPTTMSSTTSAATTVHYTFDDGFEGFSNRWGDTEHVTLENGDGAITVTSNEGEWNDSGAMMQGEGYGYGLYEFTTKVNSDA